MHSDEHYLYYAREFADDPAEYADESGKKANTYALIAIAIQLKEIADLIGVIGTEIVNRR